MDAGSFGGAAGAVGAAITPTAETIGTRSPAGAQNLISILALVLSSIALFVSGVFARRANRISASDAWVSLLLQRVAAEIEMAMQDRDLVHQLCENSYPTAQRKHEVREKLEAIRRKSAEQMHAFVALCPMGAKARDQRATLESIDESYFDNEATSLEVDKSFPLLERYDAASATYLEHLRELVGNVCSRKYHPWGKKKRWWHRKNDGS